MTLVVKNLCRTTDVPLTTPKAATSSSLPYDWPVGLEVELERVVDLPDCWFNDRQNAMQKEFCSGWRLESDGSLRNQGVEFITRGTSKGAELVASIVDLFKWKEAEKWDAHQRCGTHVHLDVRTLNTDELQTLITLYLLLEPALYAYVGEEREASIYCIPAYRASDDTDAFAQFFASTSKKLTPGMRKSQFQLYTTSRGCKYAGMNLRTLYRFGSLEMRQAPAFNTPEELLAWVGMLTRLPVAIAEFGSAKEAIQVFEEKGTTTFYADVLKDSFDLLPTLDWEALADDCDVLGVAERFNNIKIYNAKSWKPQEHKALPYYVEPANYQARRAQHIQAGGVVFNNTLFQEAMPDIIADEVDEELRDEFDE